ncbi:MAG TPA: DUF4864 domain-containing protein [Burkholderiales bacterium]|nr:DUF4864 domain-containing protein [Burkholderiales bacterium]
MLGLKRRLACAFLALAPLAAQAQAVSADDAAAVRKVIEAQLDAFKKDDAKRAFSYATSGIRATFGTPENFMEMVRTEYPVVYRPRSVTFQAPTQAGANDIVQAVRMIDDASRAWIAIYPMQRGSDGVWRTNGCRLRRLGHET